MRKFYSACLAALFISLNCVASNPFNRPNQPVKLIEGKYVKGEVIIKLKPEARTVCRTSSIDLGSMNEKLALLGATVSKKYPNAKNVSGLRSSRNEPLVDITLIYSVKFNSNTPVADAIALLSKDPSVVYAEPNYIHTCFFTPNDSGLVFQGFLTKIQALQAWDSWQGDTNTVIGIIDSGTDPNHPDLAANLKHNYADPIDGIDNDGDGFVDNFSGWDVSNHDNDPTCSFVNVHGSHVSGCAAAVTNNSYGVASPGFKCKFLPVKASLNTSSSAIDNGYDGIVYAADHGCNIINMSWGRGGGPSQFEQDIIDYAVVNHDITAVAAAGNQYAETDDYPSAYKNVVSVAATRINDNKADFSNWAYSVDVCAPGENIYSTVFSSGYTLMSGTSMASPIAAGCAAMIKSKFPSFTHEQVAEQLRNTCDNIYPLPGNVNYADKLGKGRVNLFKAVTDSVSPGVTAEVISITDDNNNVFVGADTLRIVVRFKNLLHATTNLTTQLTQSSNLNDTIIEDGFNIGVLNTFDTVSNYVQTYKVVIKGSAPINYSMPLKVVMTDGTWSDFLAFNVVVNVDYVNIEVNDISTTQTSKGRIGYNTQGPGEGLGFKYQGGPSNLFEMGLIIADGVHPPANAVRNEVAGGADMDFGYNVRVHEGTFLSSDYFASGVCNTDGPTSPSDSLPVLISHYTYAWSTNPDRGYIIVEYVIKNMSTDSLPNMYAGLYADWDVNDIADTSTSFYQSNRDSVDFLRRMGITYNTWNDGYYCGIKLLSYSAPFHHYAIDNVTGGGGGIDIYDDLDHFSDQDKYAVLSTNRDVAGHTAANGNDVCDVTSTGPRSIAPGDSMMVAFALICGTDLTSILSSADAAQQKYDTHIDVEEITSAEGQMMLGIYPNPVSRTATVTYQLEKNFQVELSLYNMMGEKVKSFSAGKQSQGEHKITIDASAFPKGNYFIQLNAGGTIEVRKMVITK
jgi:serine protease